MDLHQTTTIIFHRKGYWYPTEYPVGYADWQAEADRNPGTIQIETTQGEVLWSAKSASQENA